MADYSVYQTILVGVGTFLLLVTLWLTRQANQAAQQAVAVTREMGERQLRAYVTVRGVSLRWENGRFHARLEIVNTGQTPANAVESWIVVAIEKPPFNDAWLKDEMHFFSRSDLGAGALLRAERKAPDLPNLHLPSRLKSGEIGVWVYGTIRYTDIFNRPQVTNYRYIALIDEEGALPALPASEGNNST